MDRRPIQDSDREAIARFIETQWHSRKVISRGKVFYPHEEEGFIEWRDGQITGLLTFILFGREMEVLTLNSMLSGEGIGSALTLMAINHARTHEIRRILVTTTNDNLHGIGFYQRLGFRISHVNVGAVDEARRIKPEIPEVGQNGIPIRDEIILELLLQPRVTGSESLDHGADI
jgi:N-acetylglutamate synthase-like GNAT family acetyltransferase